MEKQLLLLLMVVPLATLARRCNRPINVYSWNPCMECSVNVFHRCPAGYRTVTGGEGVQRCSYLVHFGANFGQLAVPGCQHLCSRIIIQRECCDGFWGRNCLGM